VVRDAPNPTVNVNALAVIPVLHLWNKRVEICVFGETIQNDFLQRFQGEQASGTSLSGLPTIVS
jgi:hypothetical protein